MKLSLQSKTNLKSVYNQREKMIFAENLHINDKIGYEEFLALYKKYGEGFSETDFAKYFLDMDYLKHYGIKCGKVKKTAILLREYVSEKEILQTRKKVIDHYGLTEKDRINYREFLHMYSSFSGKLSVAQFAEEILDLSPHTIDTLKGDESRESYVFRRKKANIKTINKIIKEIIAETDLHIGDLLNADQIDDLHRRFGGNLSRKEFATRVLGLSSNTFNVINRDKKKLASIFSTYIVNPEEIYALREKVILEENLHIDDLISNERFKELHRKYGGILSENIFAEEILDISAVGVKNMRVSGTKSAILQNIEIPDEYVKQVRNKVVKENDLKKDQLFSLEEVERFYEKYGYVLSQKKFAVLILGIPEPNYNALKCGTNSRVGILKDYDEPEPDFLAIRTRVIQENHLHYRDKIDYYQFETLRRKYAPDMRRYLFAEKILDINSNCLGNLGYQKGKTKVIILKKEKLPEEAEILEIKKRLLRDYKLHRKDTINYKEFKKLYFQYGGVMPDYMFSEKMLDIDRKVLGQMKLEKQRRFQILLKTKMSEEEIKKLKEKILAENNIYVGKGITLKDFLGMYKNYDHILDQIEFARIILGINSQSLDKLKSGRFKTVKALVEETKEKKGKKKFLTNEEVSELKEYLIQNLSEEEIATKLGISMRVLRSNLKAFYKYGRLSKDEIDYERVKKLCLEGAGIRTIRSITKIDNDRLRELVNRVKVEEKNQLQELAKKRKEKKKERARQSDKNKSDNSGQTLNRTRSETRRQTKKILDKYIYTPKTVNIVKDFIKNCNSDIVSGEFKREDLGLLEECVSFVQGGMFEIAVFSKACICFRQYMKANVFITNNIDNDGITLDQKQTLRKLQDELKYSIRKEEALAMLRSGITDTDYIAKSNGILETDVLRMQRSLNGGDEPETRTDYMVAEIPHNSGEER